MTRTYESRLRDAQRIQTRRKVVDAAGELFASNGYTPTTLRMVACRAGVSLERVTSVGGKPALLLAAVEEAINDGEPLGLVRRSDIAPAWARGDLDEILDALVSFVTSSNERLDCLTTAWSEARRADPELDDAYRQRMDSMRAAGRQFVDELVDRGLVDPAVDPARVADEFWAMAHPTQYDLLVNLAGWTRKHFRDRLLAHACRLMPPARSSAPATSGS